MVQHEGLVVVDLADGIFAEMGVEERYGFEVLQVFQFHHLIDVADLVAAEVELLDVVELVDVFSYILYEIHRKVKVGQLVQTLQVFHPQNLVFAQNQSFEFFQGF